MSNKSHPLFQEREKSDEVHYGVYFKRKLVSLFSCMMFTQDSTLYSVRSALILTRLRSEHLFLVKNLC